MKFTWLLDLWLTSWNDQAEIFATGLENGSGSIYKAGSRLEVGNYRPMGQTGVLGKVLGHTTWENVSVPDTAFHAVLLLS